jgi:hypothetical protein
MIKGMGKTKCGNYVTILSNAIEETEKSRRRVSESMQITGSDMEF